mmetsp:Transcript_29991/g.52236  ORF Transcript_29991/g.52236 Transcript_29991/m.52236 type:complete len:83 (-) Transcript_29991:81-329(-)
MCRHKGEIHFCLQGRSRYLCSIPICKLHIYTKPYAAKHNSSLQRCLEHGAVLFAEWVSFSNNTMNNNTFCGNSEYPLSSGFP